MKSIKKSNSPQYNRNKVSPEIRDNLDSRKKEEQEFKGDDMTHNQKPHHNKKPSINKKER